MFRRFFRRNQQHTNDIRSSNFISLGLFILAMAAACTAVQPEPPGGYQPAVEIDLALRAYEEETIWEFALAETAVTGIFYTIPNVNTDRFDLSVVGPDGENYAILQSESFRTDENGSGTWEQSLPAGRYRLVLTASQTPSVLSVFWGTR